ncbi:hypothetical protein [Candidatus Poriferisocius sp.]|uniref:hypothetical protein n=1 Tax=Candidatus Poriferisocius sp. TaxID=3101276 RepID=UPI003B01CCED
MKNMLLVIYVVGLCGLLSCSSGDNDGVSLREYSTLEGLLDADNQYLVIREGEVQDWVADCMHKAGFEYIPWVEDAHIYDYSKSDTPVVDAYEHSLSSSENDEDPNAEIYGRLSRQEKTAYYERLWGKEDMVEGDSPSGDESRFGCYNAAWVELYGRRAVEARLKVLNASLDFDKQIESHPDYLFEEEKWLNCMSDNGYSIQKFADITQMIQDEITADAASDLTNARMFERSINTANDECSANLEVTKVQLQQELIDSSLQSYINIIIKDIANQQVSN